MSKLTDIEAAKKTGDVVLEEIWRAKDKLSLSYGHDVDRLFAVARENQSKSGRSAVDLAKKKRKP